MRCTSDDEDARDIASAIVDDLYQEGLLTDEQVGDVENFSRIVKTISKRIT